MLLVIFGAGASYDSNPRNPGPVPSQQQSSWRPPLANQLFEDRTEFAPSLNQFRQFHALVHHLQKPRVEIERELEQYQAEADAGRMKERYPQLMAVRWYLQRMLSECDHHWYRQCQDGITSYLTLLGEIMRCCGGADILLATFNYDRLIDWAIEDYTRESLGTPHSLGDIDRYTEGSFPLVKLHGSVNWGQIIEEHDPPFKRDNPHEIRELIKHAQTLRMTDRYRVCEQNRVATIARVDDDGHMLVPGLAIPVVTKTDFACPPAHLQFLENSLPRVTRILVIGWAGRDTHFIDRLKRRLPAGVFWQIVSGNFELATATIGELQPHFPGSHEFRAYPGRFSDFVTDRSTRDIFEPED